VKKPKKILDKKANISLKIDNSEGSDEKESKNKKLPLKAIVENEKNKNTKKLKEKKRIPKASQKLDVVNVDNINKEKKGGWWSQSKP
jgi:hypothetical protein